MSSRKERLTGAQASLQKTPQEVAGRNALECRAQGQMRILFAQPLEAVLGKARTSDRQSGEYTEYVVEVEHNKEDTTNQSFCRKGER